MMQGFFDDSSGGGHFVLGGYVATAEQWAEFSDDWQEMLDYAKIRYFKMSEAYDFSGEFRGRGIEKRNELLLFFFRVIERHITARVSCVLDMRAWEREAK